MTILAWNVSGGHFNPVISIAMYISEKDFGGNLVTLLILLASQFVGATIGVLLGYLAILDVTFQDNLADALKVDQNANVPVTWWRKIAPMKPDGFDYGDD